MKKSMFKDYFDNSSKPAEESFDQKKKELKYSDLNKIKREHEASSPGEGLTHSGSRTNLAKPGQGSASINREIQEARKDREAELCDVDSLDAPTPTYISFGEDTSSEDDKGEEQDG
jgi:hypothetical protein